MAAHHDGHGGSDLKVGLTGLGLGFVWILVVGAIAYWMAM